MNISMGSYISSLYISVVVYWNVAKQ